MQDFIIRKLDLSLEVPFLISFACSFDSAATWQCIQET